MARNAKRSNFDWHERPHEEMLDHLDLSDRQYRTLNALIDLNCSRVRRLPDSERDIAHLLRRDLRVWRAVRKELIDLGLIEIIDAEIRIELAERAIESWNAKSDRGRHAVEERERQRLAAQLGGHIDDRYAIAVPQLNDSYPDKSEPQSNNLNGLGASDDHRPIHPSTTTSTRTVVVEGSDSPHLQQQPAAQVFVDDADLSKFTIRLCQIGGVRYAEKHREIVREWLQSGLPIERIEQTIADRRETTREEINSLKYFDGVMRKAIAQQIRPSHANIRDPLLRNYVENDGKLDF